MLIELLIALALFSLMSVLAWRGLNTVLQSRAAVEAPGRAALALAAAWTQLEADVQAARAVRLPTPTAGTAAPPSPYIIASAQQLALLREPAQCAGCWEGVVYDIALRRDRDSAAASVLRRRATPAFTDAGAAQRALQALLGQTDQATSEAGATAHVLLLDATQMRIGVWQESPEGLGAWVTLGASIDSVFPATTVQRQSRAKYALKVEWQLGAPWDGWLSKVILLENRW